MKTVAQQVVDQYLKAICEDIIIEDSNGSAIISFPFVLSGGHFVELKVESLLDNHIQLSDMGHVLGELFLSGINITGKKQRIMNEVVEKYELQVKEDKIIAQAKIADAGNLVHAMIQALIKIGDLRFFQEVKMIHEDSITRNLRKIITEVRPSIPYSAGPKAVVEGKEEPEHRVDIAITNGTPLGVIKAIDSKQPKTLQTMVEAWAYKFEDIHQANPDVNRLSLYSQDNEIWDDNLFEIARRHSDFMFAIEEKEKISSFCREVSAKISSG